MGLAHYITEGRLLWRKRRAVPIAVILAMAISGCSGTPWLFGGSADDDDSPLPPPLQADANGVVPDPRKAKSYPDLADVPEGAQQGTSAQEQQRIADSLIADRKQAEYTSEELRGGRTAPASAPRTAAAAPPAAPAPPVGDIVAAVPPPPVDQAPLPEAAVVPPATALQTTPPPLPSPAPLTSAPPAIPAAPPPPMAPPAAGYMPPSPPSAPSIAVPPPGAAVASLPPRTAPEPAGAAPRAIPPAGSAPSRLAAAPPVAAPALPAPAPATRSGVQNGFVPPETSAFDPPRPLSDLIDRQSGLVATIYFGPGSSRLGTRDLRKIRDAVKVYEKRGGGIIRVLGHASSRTVNLSPTEQLVANWRVSQERANAVADAIIQLGVDPDIVLVEAVSDSEPIFYETMPAGEAGNRRAEIYLE